MGQLATRNSITQQPVNYFDCLPSEFQRTAALLFALHAAGMKSPRELVSRLSVWIERHGLLPEDLEAVYDVASSPRFMGVKDYGEQGLQQRIAEEVDTAIQARKARERRKAEAEQTRRDLEDAELHRLRMADPKYVAARDFLFATVREIAAKSVSKRATTPTTPTQE